MVLGVGAGLQGGEFSGGAFWSNRRHPGLQPPESSLSGLTTSCGAGVCSQKRNDERRGSFLLSHAPIIGKVASLILEQSSHLHNIKIYEENNYSICLYIC